MKTRLIFLEGAPGSGKSTLAAQLAHYMAEKSVPIRLHLEGQAEHPIDLTWHACLTRAEYDCLLAEHLRVGLGDLAERLRQKTVFCAGYALVAYRNLARPFFEGNLLARLKEKEFCYSSSPPRFSSGFYAHFCRPLARVGEPERAGGRHFPI